MTHVLRKEAAPIVAQIVPGEEDETLAELQELYRTYLQNRADMQAEQALIEAVAGRNPGRHAAEAVVLGPLIARRVVGGTRRPSGSSTPSRSSSRSGSRTPSR